jgi:sugar phosphate permease
MMAPRWRIAVFLFFAGALNYGDRAALASVIPPLRADLGATDAQIGFAGTLFLWTYALCSPLAGNLADKFSRPLIITISLATWSAVMALTGFAQSVATLLALRLLLGIAESLYLPAAGALLGDHHPAGSRGRAMGFHILGLNVGSLVGGAAAGVIAEHFGWRPGFWILGGLGLGLAALAPFCIFDKPTEVPSSVGRRPDAAGAWSYVLRVPSFYCLLGSAVAAGVAVWAFFSWLPLFFAENYGMKLGAAGLSGVVLFNAPLFLGIAIGGWLSDKVVQRDAHGRALIKGLSFLLSAPFLFLFLGTPSFPIVAAALVISSLIRALGVSSEHPLVCEVIPTRYRSTAIGIMNTCGAGAGGIGVLLAGLLKQDIGLNTIFGASSFLYVLAGLPMLWAYRYAMPKDAAKAAEFDRREAAAAVR